MYSRRQQNHPKQGIGSLQNEILARAHLKLFLIQHIGYFLALIGVYFQLQPVFRMFHNKLQQGEKLCAHPPLAIKIHYQNACRR